MTQTHNIKTASLKQKQNEKAEHAPDRDALLMLRVKEGDRQAFAILFEKYASPLYHFVYRFVGTASVAEELVQEIFFKVYRAAPNYQPKGKFSTFLYRVATNHCLNEIRKSRYKERFESIEQPKANTETQKALELKDAKAMSAEKNLIGSRLAKRLQELLLELPENQRAALLLHRMDALSYQHIADTMELTVGAVKSLIHRAKVTLQQRLGAWDEEIKRTMHSAH